MKLTTVLTVLVASIAITVAGGSSAWGDFSVSYLDGSSWNSIYAQGFSPSVSPNPDPALSGGDVVRLNQFQFFKSGNSTSNTNVQLAIIDDIFTNINGMSVNSSYFVGLSDNTIADPNSIATGDPITFTFSDLPLSYGGNYAAIMVNKSGDDLTPVLVPALVADYIVDPNSDPNAPDYIPETNYGGQDVYIYAVSNFITTTQLPPPPTSYLNTFSHAADANFVADFAVPEPNSVALALISMGLLSVGRLRRHGL